MKKTAYLGDMKVVYEGTPEEIAKLQELEELDAEKVVLQKGEVILSKEEAEKYRNIKKPVSLTIPPIDIVVKTNESMDVEKIAQELIQKLLDKSQV